MVDLISIHIPKTGGTSFYNILHQIYGAQLSPSFKRKDIEREFTEEISLEFLEKDISVLHGHFHYNELKTIQNRFNAKVICWFRDPVDRLISNYKHFLKRNSLSNPIQNKQSRVDESLLTFAQRKGTQNVMSNFLDGIALEELFFYGFVETFDKDFFELSKLMDWPSVTIPRLNATRENSVECSPAIRQKISDLNKKDCRLYEKALNLKEISF